MRFDKSTVRYIAYVLEILIFYILQGVPDFIPEVFGGKPVLLIPLAISFSVFETEVSAMLWGLFCGMMLDFGNGVSIGFYSFILTILCFFIGYAFENYFNRKLTAFLVVTLAAVPLIICFVFFIGILIKGYFGQWDYFINHYVSRIVYTFIVSPVFYIINYVLNKKTI